MEQETMFCIGLLLLVSWTLPTKSLGMAVTTVKNIPFPYQEKCGGSICDTRTQYCNRDVLEQCHLCTQGPCAFPDGKQTAERLLGCQITCPVYANTLDISCPEYSVPEVPPTPDAATIGDLNDKIGEQHVAIIGVSLFAVLLLVALAALVVYTIRLKQTLNRRQLNSMNLEVETPIYRGQNRGRGSTNSTPGASHLDLGNDSGLDTGNLDDSPAPPRGTTPSSGRPSGRPATPRTGETAPEVQLDEDAEMRGDRASGSHNTSITPMSPTQAVGGANNPTNPGFYAQPACTPTGKWNHVDVHGNPVPEVTSQPKQAAHSVDLIAEQSINARFPDRVHEDQSHSNSHWANVKYQIPDKYDTDSSTTPLLKTGTSDETSLKQLEDTSVKQHMS